MLNTLFLRPLDAAHSQQRQFYLNSLSEPQELFLELYVRQGTAFSIELMGKDIGYLVLFEKCLVEFYLHDDAIPLAVDVFSHLLDILDIRSAYCKSFDALLLNLGLSFAKNYSLIGRLFRDRVASTKPHLHVNKQLADLSDSTWIWQVNDEVFENEKEVHETIAQQNLFIYTLDDKRIGYGIFQRTIAERDSFDIGMLVLPEYRKKGYGTFIIADLAEYCEQNDWRPTCGCDIHNIASQKTLAKAGFVSKHTMIEFKFSDD